MTEATKFMTLNPTNQSKQSNNGQKFAPKYIEDVLSTDRGGIIENTHYIHAAVVDVNGKLLYAVGNPNRITLARSAAKPFQSLAIFETGAPERFNFDDADVALMCASHSSEPRHISRAREMLRRTGAKEDILACGGHPALNEAANKAWVKADYTPTGICSNCSGKHVGMIAGAICLDSSIHDYHEPDHPMQERVKKIVQEMSGMGDGQVQWAVDGCNLHAPALPLGNLAYMYATFANAQGGEGSNTRDKYLSRIFDCMSKYPDIVSGTGRFCTTLMEAYGGVLVGKIGADGCYGIGIRASPNSSLSDISPNFEGRRAIGIAVKTEDGSLEMLCSAVVEILKQLDVGKDLCRQLEDFHHPKICNTAGVVTGGVSHRFKVRQIEGDHTVLDS